MPLMHRFRPDELQQKNGHHGCPDWGAYGILAGSDKGLNAQHLPDHPMNGFDLPTSFVESRCRVPSGGHYRSAVQFGSSIVEWP